MSEIVTANDADSNCRIIYLATGDLLAGASALSVQSVGQSMQSFSVVSSINHSVRSIDQPLRSFTHFSKSCRSSPSVQFGLSATQFGQLIQSFSPVRSISHPQVRSVTHSIQSCQSVQTLRRNRCIGNSVKSVC